MALSLFQFDIDEDILDYEGVFGVLQEGITQDQVFYILQNDPDSIVNYFDPAYSGISYFEYLDLSYGADVGYIYTGSVGLDVCDVQIINNGLGGLTYSERNDENCVQDYIMISSYEFSSELYANPSFRPATVLSGVVAPVFSFASTNALILALLAVTFVGLGVRVLRRVSRSLGRGR